MNNAEKVQQRALQAHLIRTVLAVQNDCAPELLDMISGATPEEISASAEQAKAKSASLIQRALQGQVVPTAEQAAFQVNQAEGIGDQQLADQVRDMSLAEYSRNREQLGTYRSTIDFLGGS